MSKEGNNWRQMSFGMYDTNNFYDIGEKKEEPIHAAKFSSDRLYRWWLEDKTIEEGNDRICMFLMLNPSTADEQQSDPTVTRCKGYTKDWGFGTLWVCNIFAYRSTDRKVLKDLDDPVGNLNDMHIKESAEKAEIIVCAWGNDGAIKDRGKKVLFMLQSEGHSDKLFSIGPLTKAGHPGHPLYLKKDEDLLPMKSDWEEAW